jgi:hypothetical protein
MIIKQEDLKFYTTNSVFGSLPLKEDIRLHLPTGVFFSYTSNGESEEFLYFRVATITDKNEIIESKTFDGFDDKSFFEAVDYFEKLIEEKMPQEKQEQPTYGYFYFVKGGQSFVEIIGDPNKVEIDREDLDSMFTPPLKKPYGRLNGSAVDKEQYARINSKFALDFDAVKTDEAIETLSLNKDEVFVYKMIAYQNSENSGEPTPQGVNDDSLSLDEIEGEEPQNMEGSNEEPQEGEPQDGEPQEGEPQDGEPQDGEPQDGEPQEGDSEDGEEKDGKEDFNNPNPQPSDETSDEEGQIGESNEEGEQQEGEPLKGTREQEEPTDVYGKVGQFLGTDDLVYSYKKKARVISLLNSSNLSDLSPLINSLNLPDTISKTDLLSYISNNLEESFS